MRQDIHPPSAWVSISDYARTYGIHRNTAAKWVKLGAVECYRKGHTIRVKNQPPTETPRTSYQSPDTPP